MERYGSSIEHSVQYNAIMLYQSLRKETQLSAFDRCLIKHINKKLLIPMQFHSPN